MPLDPNFTHIPGPLGAQHGIVDAQQWQTIAEQWRGEGGILLALWGSDERDRHRGFSVWAALFKSAAVTVLELPLSETALNYPSLAAIFPSAERMERAIRDLYDLDSRGNDKRPWTRHASWADDEFPLRRDFVAATGAAQPPERYDFVRVHGDGVHEIAVGPVHAGVIEPGHFRFSVVGEKVLRLEQRLGYTHKGIEKRFETLTLDEGRRLAARVSGDSAVAFSWAYCMALEGLCAIEPAPRALALRALALERERIANHLGDLGALGNDAGFGFGMAQFSRLKEQLLRTNAEVWGRRYLMDEVIPGGVANDIETSARKAILTQCDYLETEVAQLEAIYSDHAGVQDRFVGCGRITPELAVRLALVGFAARASGSAVDLRCDTHCPPYDRLTLRKSGSAAGDVAARVALRVEEIFESLRLCRALLADLPLGSVQSTLTAAQEGVLGLGVIEGWRGPVVVALSADPDGRVRRCHPHDPSWQNWPALEHAVIGNIVPDFPLINKSFNLSYSGQDL